MSTRQKIFCLIVLIIFIGGFVYLSPEIIAVSEEDNIFKGFVIGDAHIGYHGNPQPSTSIQEKMLELILNRFPDLDVFVDAGDFVHGNARVKDWQDYVEIVANNLGQVPFFLTAGNHELSSPHRDEQWNTGMVGNFPFRPYFSMDIKNIHLVSFPVLLPPSIVTQESLEWLKLDLELNKDKTIILFSHNSITGTTKLFRGNEDYRRIVNSDQVMEILEDYPNVIGWIHGHNHLYDVVEHDDIVHVSAGRFGGFKHERLLNYAVDHLGGFYFEVGENHFKVQGYSATENKFLEEVNFPELSNTVEIESSLNPVAKPSFYYGGNTRSGLKEPILNFYTSSSDMKNKLFIKGNHASPINNNTDFCYAGRGDKYPGGDHDRFFGFQIRPIEAAEWMRPGLKLENLDDNNSEISLEIPNRRTKGTYYRIAPDDDIDVNLNLSSEKEKGSVQFDIFISRVQRYTSGRSNLDTFGPIRSSEIKIKEGRQEINKTFELPDHFLLNQRSIYTEKNSNDIFLIEVHAIFSDIEEVMVDKFEVVQTGTRNEDHTVNPYIKIGDEKYSYEGQLAQGEIKEFDLSSLSQREVFEFEAEGSEQFTWLVQQKDVEWQVRNGLVQQKGDYVEVGPHHNIFDSEKKIIIAPLFEQKEPFVHQLQFIEKVKIYPFDNETKKIGIKVMELMGEEVIKRIAGESGIAKVIVFTEEMPREVKGVKDWQYERDYLEIKVKKEDNIEILF